MEPTPDPKSRDIAPPEDILSEFITALQEEIAAVRRNGSAASVRLKNGRFITRIGSRFHYTFQMETPLGPFWDAPADLYIPGHPSLDITLLSTSGLTLFACLPNHMGGLIESASVHFSLTDILGKWIERLENFRNRPNPAGERIRGMRPVSGAPAAVAEAKDLDADQARAVASALGHDATFILSPPGAGRIRTIAEIVRLLYDRNHSVLIASRSSRGADQIILEISRRIKASGLENGRIIRVGDSQTLKLGDDATLLAETQAALKAEAPMKLRARLTEELRAAEARSVKISRRIDILAWLAHGENDLQEMDRMLLDLQGKKRLLEQRRRALKEMSRRAAFWREASEEAKKIQKVEAGGLQFADRMGSLGSEISDLAAKLDDTVARLAEARDLYGKTSSAGWLSRQLRQLPTPEQQKDAVDRLEAETSVLRKMIDAKQMMLNTLENSKAQLDSALERFNRTYPGGRDDILKQRSLCQTHYEPLNRETKKLNKAYHDSRIGMAGLLSARLKSLNSWGLTQVSGGTPEIVLNAIKEGYANARSETRGLDIETLRRELARLENDIAAYRIELQTLLPETGDSDGEPSLAKMEERIIAEAAVVVTTLSNVCLQDAIQSRKFDTVIIDDASMAPIPAVWMAAGLAASRVVVLGDPNQLPPTVMSDSDLARKWLGRDVFEASGFTGDEADQSFRVTLHHRYGIHPRISALADQMRGDRRISDQTPQFDDGEHLPGWYDAPWEHDSPLLMIDTGPSNAWITRVAGDDPSDRMNFVSAALCVSAASAVLREDRKPLAAGEDPRVLIITPYAAQAALLDLMIRRRQLEDEVHAGTPESLFASPAPVVIVDMVEDDPFSGAPMFKPSADPLTLRRINTFLGRAQCRLIVIGNFGHIEKRAQEAVTGSMFLPELRKRSTVIQAPDLIRERLPAGGPADRSKIGIQTGSLRPVVSREDSIESLTRDIEAAEERVVVYSPVLDMDRLAELKKTALAARENDVRIYVVTRPLKERRKNEAETYGLMERALDEWGVTVIHQMRLHEKIVMIDDRIFWFGSFDPLGPADPPDGADVSGAMAWRADKPLADYAARRLRLNKLVDAFDGRQRPSCPICGGEVVAAAGRHLPYYWRCIENRCYSRSIDQLPATPAKKTAIRCARCSGEVEFGTWGGKPCWRCLANRRHRQPIARTHLITPETAERIPPKVLARLMKAFKLAPPSS